MKKVTLFLSILFVTSALLSGCKKDDDDSSVADKGGMSAKINGSDWKSATTGSASTGSSVSLSGISSDGKTISISMGDTVGTYTITDSTFNAIGNYNNGATSYTGRTGTIVVTEVNTTDETISGTFSFTGKPLVGTDSVTVTEGSFNQVEY